MALSDLDALASIEPLASRVAVARERLAVDASVGAASLDATLVHARQGEPRARRALLACSIALVQGEGEQWVRNLARATREQRHAAAAALFSDALPHRRVLLPGRLSDPCVSRMYAWIFASLDQKARARAYWLPVPRILMHPDAEVVRRLLGAPALRLNEALVIASRRPTSDAIVREITSSLRWIARVEVREALVGNPFVKPAVALALLPTLLHGAQRSLRRGGIHPIVREAARLGTS